MPEGRRVQIVVKFCREGANNNNNPEHSPSICTRLKPGDKFISVTIRLHCLESPYDQRL
ncbi:unnamed protein product, partial [Nesidiocoris tenuis]